MTTTYTDARIEELVEFLRHFPTAAECRDAANVLESLLAERQAASRGQGDWVMARELTDWLNERSLIPDVSEDGSFDMAKLIEELNEHERQIMAPQPVRSVSDEVRGWDARALDRCCTELTNLINLADDYEFDEVTVQTFQTSIECIRVCKQAANGQEKQHG